MSKETPLTDVRSEIDSIDRGILDLLEKRNQIVKKVIETKIAKKLPIFIADRENEKIVQFRKEAVKRGLDPEWAEDFLRMIMSSSRASQSERSFPSATNETKRFLIIGGRGGMGKLYARFAENSGHIVTILDKDDWNNVEELSRDIDVAIVTVPIHLTDATIRKIAPYLSAKTILADFTSTKQFLIELMKEVHNGPVVSLHPMHGPDVTNLSKQLMLVLPGRNEKSYKWLITQFELWGMRTKIVDPDKHDHAMHMIQGLRHFIALLHGSFMRAYDLKPEDILDFSSPIYRAELMMTGRIFAQDARLYADIVFSDDKRRQLLMHFFKHHYLITNMVEQGDKEEFVHEFEEIRDFFGSFADQALKESGYLIHRLADRFS